MASPSKAKPDRIIDICAQLSIIDCQPLERFVERSTRAVIDSVAYGTCQEEALSCRSYRQAWRHGSLTPPLVTQSCFRSTIIGSGRPMITASGADE